MKKLFYGLYNRLGFHSTALLGVLIGLSIIMRFRSPYFLTWFNFEILFMGFILEAIMAIGMTLVIISGGIDLSVSSVLPFSAILTGLLITAGVPVGLAVGITLLAALSIGMINATLKIVLAVHPFIATLAMMLTVRGLAVAMSSGQSISGFPDEFAFLGQGYIAGIPVPIIIFVVLAGGLGTLLRHHKFFQQIYFIGYDSKAARVSGINVTLMNYFVFGLSALLAGLAGIIAASQYGTAHNSFAIGAELKVIAAVVIGGTNIVRGGEGNMFGTVLGVLFMAIVFNAFAMSGIDTYWQEIVNGIMLLVAIFMVEAARKKQNRSAVG
ncbi:MAG: ABC transporter permease [Spirochaeta sp.]|jgi:ribose transport system permease protein|nr:ABC transporter permease [Spirochaeta sp.]